jgi:hypothetical protein
MRCLRALLRIFGSAPVSRTDLMRALVFRPVDDFGSGKRHHF